MAYNVPPLEDLIDKFASLPGIGRKSAQRIAFHLLSKSESDIKSFADVMIKAKADIHCCSVCQTFTDADKCSICANVNRDESTICVVENSKDVMALERTNEYKGLYHVLHGLMSPIDGITPDRLKIKELVNRVAKGNVKEVIMATNPTVEGDTTALYISKLIAPFEVKVTRLAYGIPVGGSLEYSDDVTLLKAFEGRTQMN